IEHAKFRNYKGTDGAKETKPDFRSARTFAWKKRIDRCGDPRDRRWPLSQLELAGGGRTRTSYSGRAAMCCNVRVRLMCLQDDCGQIIVFQFGNSPEDCGNHRFVFSRGISASVMKRMRGFSRRQLCRLSVVTALISVLAIFSVANARQHEPDKATIVALGFDGGSQTILKAYPQALYRSGDEGAHWSRISLPKAITGGKIAAVAVSSQRKNALYIAGPGIGILRSEDDGRSWVARNKGLPRGRVVALVPHADQPDTLYAYIAGRGIFRSEHAGIDWRLMDKGPREAILQIVHSNMPGSMQTGWFFAATKKGVRRSMDCFCGWRDAGGLAHPVSTVAYDPHQPKQVYAATGEGLFLSLDGGEHWARVNSPGSVITALIVAPSGVLYAAAGDGGLFRSVDRANTWGRIDA
ncbi:MAG: hypothetical protein ABIS45_01815, partial [Burkholderiales bacterium]